MPGEDQERFEDYLELEHYIEELQAGHVAHPPAELTSSQARIYRMATLFRSASPEAASPRPEFAEQLRARLEQELQQPSHTKETPIPLPSAIPNQPKDQQQQGRRRVSRRALLTGGAAVAASLVVGAGIERVVEQAVDHTAHPATAGQDTSPDVSPTASAALNPEPLFLLPPGVPITQHFVTTLDQLGNQAIPFRTATVVGYVIRDDDTSSDPNNIVAISAACTHRGCIVQWQNSDRKFHCPCHSGLFSEYGLVEDTAGPLLYLTPLPRLRVVIKNNTDVYVEVPQTSATPVKSA